MNWGNSLHSGVLPRVVTLWSRGQAPAWRVRVHHLERRPSSTPRSRVSRRHVGREVGLGQQAPDDRRCVTSGIGADRRTRGGGRTVKIRAVKHNNRKKTFEIRTSTKTLVLPFSQGDPAPTVACAPGRSQASMPTSAEAILLLIWPTAILTPLPP